MEAVSSGTKGKPELTSPMEGARASRTLEQAPPSPHFWDSLFYTGSPDPPDPPPSAPHPSGSALWSQPHSSSMLQRQCPQDPFLMSSWKLTRKGN